MNKKPVLRGYLKDDQIHVHCPFCDQEHSHGIPSGSEEETILLKGKLTHRNAHCKDSQGRKAFTGGYWIGLWKEIKLYYTVIAIKHYRMTSLRSNALLMTMILDSS